MEGIALRLTADPNLADKFRNRALMASTVSSAGGSERETDMARTQLVSQNRGKISEHPKPHRFSVVFALKSYLGGAESCLEFHQTFRIRDAHIEGRRAAIPGPFMASYMFG